LALARATRTPVVAEADEVGASVAVDVGDEARVAVDTPAGSVAERRAHAFRSGEAATRLPARHPDAVVAEAHEVGTAVATEVGDQALVPIAKPAGGGAERSWD
jgi:hypothetical protein